jgi:hypothetical protein
MSEVKNWHGDSISLDTIVTKTYKMTQNVRRFFRQHVGEDFHFNRDFMAWMNTNIGITMRDAVEEAKRRKMANG